MTISQVGRNKIYNRVASSYDHVFTNFKVRRDEWNWLKKKLFAIPHDHVLDLGCGNGAFLNCCAPSLREGWGLDTSEVMIAYAQRNNSSYHNLKFKTIDDAKLPFADNTFDVVLSILSFRYLNWSAILPEMKRVLKPGGSLLIVDMASCTMPWNNGLNFLWDGFHSAVRRWFDRDYHSALKKLVESADWKEMLNLFPIRPLEEYRVFFDNHLPDGRIKILNAGWKSLVFGFDSGRLKIDGDGR